MGDKAILTEILEASHLTEAYQHAMTPRGLLEGFLRDEHRSDNQPQSSVRYEGFNAQDDSIGSEGRVEFGGALRAQGGADGDEDNMVFWKKREPPPLTQDEKASATTNDDASPDKNKKKEKEREPSEYLAVPGETFTVDQAVDALGFGKFQVKLSLLTGIAWMADAMEMMILAILSPALHCDWWLSSWQQAFITTIVFTGMMLSSTIWGNICDKYGRRTGLILSAAVTFYFGLLSAMAPSFVWLLILRGLTGFGIGGVPQSVTLYAEFLPSTHRAKCVVLIEAFWAIGAVFEVLLAWAVMESLGWRWLLGFSALPCLIFCLSCLWLPESARYQVACGHPEAAYNTLKRIADENGKPMLLGKLVEPGVQTEGAQRGRIVDLFANEELRNTTMLLWFIWCANAFCYYGLVIFTTQLFENGDECHGGHVKDVSIGGSKPIQTTCPLECHRLNRNDYADLLWTTLAEFPGLLLTAMVVDYLGRKLTLGFEFSIFSLFTFLLFICLDRTVLTVFLFVARAFISGAFQAAYVYTPEVYPTTMRAIGLGSCSGMARLGAIVTPFVAQVAAQKSVTIPIAVYGVVGILGTIASLLLPIETKGRELRDTHH